MKPIIAAKTTTPTKSAVPIRALFFEIIAKLWLLSIFKQTTISNVGNYMHVDLEQIILVLIHFIRSICWKQRGYPGMNKQSNTH